MFDYLIIGCGLSGATCARLLAEKGKQILVVDKRNHIGGNVYDSYNQDGILVHNYGPHIFHTMRKQVWDFLSRFTGWRNYQHRVLAFADGMLVPMPINIDTINMLYGTNYSALNISDFFESVKEVGDTIENAEDMVLCKVGRKLYELFFEKYTIKQWGIAPSKLDKEVTARIPIRHNRDDRYFADRYQGLPEHGYTRMVEKILNHTNIKLMLNTDYKEIVNELKYENIICSAPIDYYFDYKYGELPYRSLHFEFETHHIDQYQTVGTVNYPNDYDFTRITEFKHLTGQKMGMTTIVKEYPSAEGEPYYPIPQQQTQSLYHKYQKEAENLQNVYFVGRLGRYKYANMDVAVEDAMKLIEGMNL